MHSPLVTDYVAAFPQSAALATRAANRFPSGVTHDSRFLAPFGVAVDRASGAIKTTIEGRPLIDYWVGHGSLLLGHAHPALQRAVSEQAARGTHFGASHPLELQWGELVSHLVPSAEVVRFTSSGTEATLLAIRIARAATGRHVILKFAGHFHGWHDAVMPAAYAPYDDASLTGPGLSSATTTEVAVIPPNDPGALARALDELRPAAVILEATGGHWGQVPLAPGFLAEVRALTRQADVLLILDEVISGFRVHPGGVQAHAQVTPDLTALAKVLAGGLPGGAVGGRADLMRTLAFGREARLKIRHPGTYNANPLSAAAGIAMLREVAQTDACEQASRAGARLRALLNRTFRHTAVPWIAYGQHSMIWIVPDYDGPAVSEDGSAVPYAGELHRLDAGRPAHQTQALRMALLLEGVDWFGWGGMTSTAHTTEVIDETATAFARAIERLRACGCLDEHGRFAVPPS